MTIHQTNQIIQLKRGTAADLVELDPIPMSGEIVVELDTGRFKIGDGELHWTELAYANSSGGYDSSVYIQDVIGLRNELNNKQDIGNYVLTTDPRLSDARPPVTHTHQIGEIVHLSDELDLRQPVGDYVIRVAPPASATAAGAPGQIAYDSDFVYVCVAANVWRRASLSSWS
jgi:hypothetical protein